jgi:hypothetical protein
MTLRSDISALQERIASGKARRGDVAQLAALLRQISGAYDIPGGLCKPVTIEMSEWTKKHGQGYKWTANREDFT